MDNREIARVLAETATLLELKGENPFKSRAYLNAVRTIEALDSELAGLVGDGQLIEIEGIGQGLAEKISELVITGRLAYLERLRAEIPVGLIDLLRIPDSGPRVQAGEDGA